MKPFRPTRSTAWSSQQRAYSESGNDPNSPRLTHLNERGEPKMVDVSDKQSTQRTATARAKIVLGPTAFRLVTNDQHATSDSKEFAKARRKGDVLMTSKLAGIMASKQTWSLIPLCHPIALSSIDLRLDPVERDHSIDIAATATCQGQTGVEMEALVAANVAALTVWDMCKAVAGREMLITDIRVTSKTGGKSGDWKRE